MKPPERSLADIAAAHGYALKVIGQKGAQAYQFTKGKLDVRFDRKGHGALSVMWGDFNAFWPKSFEVAGTRVYMANCSREEYADLLLTSLTEEAVLTRIHERLTEDVERERLALARAEARLSAFHAARSVQ